MKKQWQILQPDIQSIEILCKSLKIHPAAAAVLVNREIVSPEKAGHFLNTCLTRLRPPFAIKDLKAAVRRITVAVKNNEKILIFGDYDVDGITATAILLQFLRHIGADVSYYIPHRTKEGYGLHSHHIADFVLPQGINLIITVDCGSGSHEAVEAANAAGIDVIITDHHILAGPLPRAVAVVNPKRRECTAGFDTLAGVGVAFYLLIALRKHLRDMHFWQNRAEPNLKKACDLVALGTLADMVPLVDENRILAKTGLDIINTGDRPGIKALILAMGIAQHSVDSNDVLFSLAPMLNAAGRIDHASLAVELLTTDNPAEAAKITGLLTRLNDRRRHVENSISDSIQAHLTRNPHLLQKQSLVLSGHDWHVGVLGIVAARIVQTYFRPVVLLKTSDGYGIGSARSIRGFDMVEGLRSCAKDLESFGGHSMAAGLKIRSENIDHFRKNFENTVGRMTKPDDFIPKIIIDCKLDFNDISDVLIDELESLQPFGTNNPEPVFMAANLEVIAAQTVGRGHCRMQLKQALGPTQKTFGAIYFNAGKHAASLKKLDKVAFRLRWNRWKERKFPQIVVADIK